MSMRKRIAKGVGYAVAPKATFAALHPRKAAYAKATTWVIDRMMPGRRRRSRGRSMATGLGAAAVAIPMGMWLGRRLMNREHTSTQTTH